MRHLAIAAAVLGVSGVAVAATYPAPTLTLQSSFSPPTGIARSDAVDQVTSTPAATVVAGERIITVGESGSGNSGDVGVVVHRLDGTMDTSFSDDGRLVIAIGAGSVEDRAVDVLALPDGRLRILAGTGSGSSRDSALIGLTASGAPDTDFGASDGTADGIVLLARPATPNVPAAFTLTGDGRMALTGVVAGTTDDSFVALRAADGSPVPTFGPDPAGMMVFDRSGTAAADGGVDVALRPGGGIVVLGQLGASGATTPYLRAFTETGAPDPAFSEDGDLAPSIGDAPTEPRALLSALGRLWITGSTRTGVDTNAFLARLEADGSGLQSRQFDMRGQLIDPAQAVTSVGDALALVAGTPDTLVVTGSVASSASTDWGAAAFNNLGGDLASASFGDIAISIPGSGGINAAAPGPGGTVAVTGPYQETVTTPSSSVTYTRTGEARLVVDAEKACDLAITVPRPLELVTPPRTAAPVTLKVTNQGTRACGGVISVPAPWTLAHDGAAGPVTVGALAPGESTTLTGLTLAYDADGTGPSTVVFTLAASSPDSDTSDNAARLQVRFGLCDVGLRPLGGRAFMPNEGSRRFTFSLANGGTTSCTTVRIRVTGQGRRTSRALPFVIGPGREFTDSPAVALRKRAKIGSRVLIGFRSVSGSTDLIAANDGRALAPRVVGVGDTDARRPRGDASRIAGIARAGRGPAAAKQLRVTKVSVAVRRLGAGCRWLAAPGKARFRNRKAGRKGSCPNPVWLPARGTAHWRLRTRGLPAGTYELLSRATIAMGFSEASFTRSDRNRVRFRTSRP